MKIFISKLLNYFERIIEIIKLNGIDLKSLKLFKFKFNLIDLKNFLIQLKFDKKNSKILILKIEYFLNYFHFHFYFHFIIK